MKKKGRYQSSTPHISLSTILLCVALIIIAVLIFLLLRKEPVKVETPNGISATESGNVEKNTDTISIPGYEGISLIADSSGFAVNKNLEVTVTYGAFESESVETTIPYMLRAYPVGATWVAKTSGSVFTFKGKTDGTVATYAYHLPSTTGADETTIGSVGVYIASSAWGQALAGEYSSTITFTSEVVVE